PRLAGGCSAARRQSPVFSFAASSGCANCSPREREKAMSPNPTDAAERERRRNEVLAACLEDPVLAAELKEFLADRDWLQGAVAPLRCAPSPPPLSPEERGENTGPFVPEGRGENPVPPRPCGERGWGEGATLPLAVAAARWAG